MGIPLADSQKPSDMSPLLDFSYDFALTSKTSIVQIGVCQMTVFAYCRVSTLDQCTQMQEDAIKERYPDAIVRTEKESGSSTAKREVLKLLLEMVHDGDKLVVWKLDRLARNMNDLTNIVTELEGKGASLEILDQQIDTGTAAGKAFLQMLGVFAEFEANLRKERQLAGIQKAKADGKYKGRPATIDKDSVEKLLTEGRKPTAIARELGISRDSVYRVKRSLASHNSDVLSDYVLQTTIEDTENK